MCPIQRMNVFSCFPFVSNPEAHFGSDYWQMPDCFSPMENFKRWSRNPVAFLERGNSRTARPSPGPGVKLYGIKWAFTNVLLSLKMSVAHRTHFKLTLPLLKTSFWIGVQHRTLVIQKWMEDKPEMEPESERGLQAQHWHYRQQDSVFTAMQSFSIKCMNKIMFPTFSCSLTHLVPTALPFQTL